VLAAAVGEFATVAVAAAALSAFSLSSLNALPKSRIERSSSVNAASSFVAILVIKVPVACSRELNAAMALQELFAEPGIHAAVITTKLNVLPATLAKEQKLCQPSTSNYV